MHEESFVHHRNEYFAKFDCWVSVRHLDRSRNLVSKVQLVQRSFPRKRQPSLQRRLPLGPRGECPIDTVTYRRMMRFLAKHGGEKL